MALTSTTRRKQPSQLSPTSNLKASGEEQQEPATKYLKGVLAKSAKNKLDQALEPHIKKEL
jgi:hypothetical protein